MPGVQPAIAFKSPEAQRQIDLEDAIKAKSIGGGYVGGVLGEEILDRESGKTTTLLHIGNPYDERPQVVTLPTRCTKQEIDEIRGLIIPMRESYEILSHLALAWRMNHPLYIEGETSIGKTFIVDKFTELVYGKGIKPIDIYCVEETEASELLGKWVPLSASEEDREKLRDYLKNPFGAKRLAQIQGEIEQAKELSPAQLEALAQERLGNLAEDIGLSHKAQWQFTKGALLKAMTASIDENGNVTFKNQGSEGDGLLLHVQEIGLARPGIATTFLQLGGTHGETRDELQLFHNGGHRIKAGSMFRVVFTNNPPKGKYLKRNPIDPALERRCDVVRVGDLSAESYRLAAAKFLSYQAGNNPSYRPADQVFLDLSKQPEITKETASIVAAFHMEYKDKVEQSLSGGRTQEISVTLDYMAKVAQFLATCQLCSRETGRLDLAATLRRGIEMFYINRLPPQDAVQLQKEQESLKDQVRQQFESLLTGKETGSKDFRGQQRTRKDILDILVREALIAVETGGDQKQIAERFKQLSTEEMRQHNDTLIGRLLRSPHLARPYKQKLKGPSAIPGKAPGESQGADTVLDPQSYRDRRITFFLECVESLRRAPASIDNLARERDLLHKISRLADPNTFFGLKDIQSKEVLIMPDSAYLTKTLRAEGEVRAAAFTPDGKKFIAGIVMPQDQDRSEGIGKIAILGLDPKSSEEKMELLFMGSTPDGALPLQISPDCSRLITWQKEKLTIYSMADILTSAKNPDKMLEIDLQLLNFATFSISPAADKFAIANAATATSEIGLNDEIWLRVYPLKKGLFKRAETLEVALHNMVRSLSFTPDASSLLLVEEMRDISTQASKKNPKMLHTEALTETAKTTPHVYIVRRPGVTIHMASADAVLNTIVTIEESAGGDYYVGFYPLSALGKGEQIPELARTRIPEPIDPSRIEIVGDRIFLKHQVLNSADVTEMLGDNLARFTVYKIEADHKIKAETSFLAHDNPPHRSFGPVAIAPGTARLSTVVNRISEEQPRGDAVIGIFDY